jgi:protein phosphatase
MTSPITRVPQPGLAWPLPVGAGLTHAGLQREANEDAILTDPSGALWAVADGMGGYGHGDVAADMVIDHLSRLPHDGTGAAGVAAALAEANRAIRVHARATGIAAMGATAVALLISGPVASVVWAGDSRAYLLREGRLRRLTRDHSVVQDLIERGRLRPEEAEDHPQGHIVTRAVGATDELEAESRELALARGDVILLASDGLTRCVPEPEIAALLGASREPETACRRLVEAALEHGAPDNVSVIVVAAGGPIP